jgi:hypothetical protein
LREIVEYQNAGDIVQVYTCATVGQFETDLWTLKAEYSIVLAI